MNEKSSSSTSSSSADELSEFSSQSDDDSDNQEDFKSAGGDSPGSADSDTSVKLDSCWKCPVCEVVLTNKRSKRQHLRTHGNGGDGSLAAYKCFDCSFKCGTAKLLAAHLKLTHLGEHVQDYTCADCGEDFYKKSELKRHARSHGLLSSRSLGLECIMCFKKFATSNSLGNHYQLKHLETVDDDEGNGKRYKCVFCEISYVGQGSLKEHIFLHHLNKKLHQCEICHKEFIRKDNLIKHIQSAHKSTVSNHESDSEQFASDVENANQEKYKSPFIMEQRCPHNQRSMSSIRQPSKCTHCGLYCTACSYIFTTKKKFSGHTHDNFCVECRVKFRNGKLFQRHKTFHDPNTEIKCYDCLFGFQTHEQFQNHLRIWHSIKSLCCPVCGKEFYSKNNLNVHKIIHKERKWKCEICSKAFLTRAHLTRHTSTHDRETPGRFLCKECGNTFETQQDLSRHKEVTHGIVNIVKQINCKECGQSFKTVEDLNRHVDAHFVEGGAESNRKFKKNHDSRFSRTNRKHKTQNQTLTNAASVIATEVKCDVCDKVCASEAKLKIHKRVHSHICYVCSKSFSSPRYLRLHLNIHRDDKPFRCGICPSSYLKRQALTTHMINNHNFKPNYFCEPCSIPFFSKISMDKHLKNRACEKRRASRRKELERRVERARQLKLNT